MPAEHASQRPCPTLQHKRRSPSQHITDRGVTGALHGRVVAPRKELPVIAARENEERAYGKSYCLGTATRSQHRTQGRSAGGQCRGSKRSRHSHQTAPGSTHRTAVLDLCPALNRSMTVPWSGNRGATWRKFTQPFCATQSARAGAGESCTRGAQAWRPCSSMFHTVRPRTKTFLFADGYATNCEVTMPPPSCTVCCGMPWGLSGVANECIWESSRPERVSKQLAVPVQAETGGTYHDPAVHAGGEQVGDLCRPGQNRECCQALPGMSGNIEVSTAQRTGMRGTRTATTGLRRTVTALSWASWMVNRGPPGLAGCHTFTVWSSEPEYSLCAQ